MKMIFSKRFAILFAVFLVIFGVGMRFLPHQWNFVPVAAIALSTSAYFGFSYALGIVFVMMAVSDISLGFYDWRIMLAVYGSFLIIALMGLILKKKRSVLLVLSTSFGGSMLFFFMTNFAVWLFSGMYLHTLAGLSACFVAALPFFRGTLLGDLAFNALFFGIFETAIYLSSVRARTRFGVRIS